MSKNRLMKVGLASALSLSLFACGTDDETTEETDTTAPEETTEETTDEKVTLT